MRMTMTKMRMTMTKIRIKPSRWWPTVGLASRELVLRSPTWQVFIKIHFFCKTSESKRFRHCYSPICFSISFKGGRPLLRSNAHDKKAGPLLFMILLGVILFFSWGRKAAGRGEGGKATLQASRFFKNNFEYFFRQAVGRFHFQFFSGKPGRRQSRQRRAVGEGALPRVFKWEAGRRVLSMMSLLLLPAMSTMSLLPSKPLQRTILQTILAKKSF